MHAKFIPLFFFSEAGEQNTRNTTAVIRLGLGDYLKDDCLDRKRNINKKHTIDFIDLAHSEYVTHQGV